MKKTHRISPTRALVVFFTAAVFVLMQCGSSSTFYSGEKAARKRNVYALIVAIQNYKDKGINDLRYTVNDASKMRDFVLEGHLGKTAPTNVVFLADEKAGRRDILRCLDTLFAKARPHDLVLFYFSGHGGKGSFAPYDAASVLLASDLPHAEIKKRFRKSKAKYKLLIADACLSGSMKTNARTQSDTTATASTHAEVAVLLSSRANESSLENSALRQGVFSYFLLKALRGAANKDGDRVLTMEELYYYVRDSTYQFAREKYQKNQCPVLYGKFDRQMPIVHYKK